MAGCTAAWMWRSVRYMALTRVACYILTLANFFFLVPSPALSSSLLPNNATIALWSNELEHRLSWLVQSVSSVKSAEESYNEASSDAVLKDISSESLLDDVLEKMTELLDRKRKALRRLVNEAEAQVIYLDKTYGSMLELDDVPFFNMKEAPRSIPLTFSPRLRQRVYFEQSGVHIPLEIFDGYPEILNGLNWTESLDDVFKYNWEQDPTLRWQYFGSTFGFMRVYPAFRWPDHPSLPDLFDVRRRTWYVQGSVSPKDMIILIDRSGSVHGQTLDIMKITVRALLNSLSENDYVNVAWFTNKVSWVVPCVDGLVQATAQNRRLLSDAVERLTESDLTSYVAALDFAFEAFRKFDEIRKPWGGSNCHKAIMFLSDGGTDWPQKLVSEHCNQSRTSQIKIFTFACGPHPIPTVVLKQMACATGGYFSPITALGSVRVKVQDYVRVLSRPLAYSALPDLYQWHNFYRDIAGLGMMTTVTLPVYSKNEEMYDRLLGVMGIDVPVEEMANLFPKNILGALGYAFSVNTNGFVVFHPRLRDHIVYIEDPPDVDLTDLEGVSPEVEQMRRDMVDGRRGKLLNISSIVPVGLGHAIVIDMNYYYGSVQSSTFRFGIGVPAGTTVAHIHLSHIDKAVDILTKLKGSLLIAPWRFCPAGEFKESLTPDELANRIRYNFSTCDKDLVHHLLWDALKAEAMLAAWKESYPGVNSRFLMTRGGLTLLNPALIAEDYMRQRDPFRNNLYKWASQASGCVLSVARGRSYDIVVGCRVTYKNYVTAVIGVEMERSLVQTIFEEVTTRDEGPVNCQDNELLHCYLLNDGGVIIAGNQPDIRAGEFIGQMDVQILTVLLESGVLGREHRFNYQSWCSKGTYQVQVTASAPRLSRLHSFLQPFYLLDFGFIYSIFLNFIFSIPLWGHVQSSELPSPVNNHSCVTRSSWYYLTGNPGGGKFWCTSGPTACEREIKATILDKLSLILVIAAPPCLCDKRITLESVEPQDVGPDHCVIKQRYRKRPEECFVEMPQSNYTDCGGGSVSSSKRVYYSTSLIFNLLLLLVCYFW